jgi:hypothetical protein
MRIEVIHRLDKSGRRQGQVLHSRLRACRLLVARLGPAAMLLSRRYQVVSGLEEATLSKLDL